MLLQFFVFKLHFFDIFENKKCVIVYILLQFYNIIGQFFHEKKDVIFKDSRAHRSHKKIPHHSNNRHITIYCNCSLIHIQLNPTWMKILIFL